MANTIDNMARCGVAWFKMDETSSTALIDSKGNNLVANINGTSIVTGINGNARSFNNGYIRFQSSVLPFGKKSIRFRIKTTQVSNNYPHIFKNNVNNTNDSSGFCCVMNANGMISFANRVNSSTVSYTSSSIPINDGQWHDILYTQSGGSTDSEIKLYIDNMLTPELTRKLSIIESSTAGQLILGGNLLSNTLYNAFVGQIDEFEIYNDVISAIPNKTLVIHNGIYKYYTTSWKIIGTTVTDEDYKVKGMDDISIVPESAWRELDGNIELCYWTDAPNKTGISFNIDTEPFTLAEEWDGQTIQLIEYTDDPNKTESIITLETEPFTLYDEFNDSIDVLYYTNDLSKNSANLNIHANYSPLDEINGDFDIITWTNDENEFINKKILTEAIPKPKIIKQITNFTKNGIIKSMNIDALINGNGLIKLAISGDSGLTWKTFKHKVNGKNELYNINVDDLIEMKSNGFSLENLSLLNEQDWIDISPNGIYRFAYYIEQKNINDVAKINSLISNELCVTDTPKVSNINIIYDATDKKYYGLMFVDENYNYYSTSIGEILQYLDFGTLIAGQTSLEVEIILVNSYNFKVNNLQLSVVENFDGVKVELSKTINPFIAENSLLYNEIFEPEQEIKFYVRLVIDRNAHIGGGFDIKVKADPIKE